MMNKKYSFSNKAAAILLAVSLPLTVFAGCQNKNTSANAASNQAGNANNNGSKRQNGSAPNLDQFKQRLENNIKPLVDDKTLTQEQADKIVAALTENMQGFGGRQRNDQSNQGGQNNNQNSQNGSQSNGQGNTQNNNQGNAQNGQNNSQNRQNGRANQESIALSKLVTDKVITQAQADAVMQKIRGNFNRPQNNQNQQNNNNNNNNNNSNQGA